MPNLNDDVTDNKQPQVAQDQIPIAPGAAVCAQGNAILNDFAVQLQYSIQNVLRLEYVHLCAQSCADPYIHPEFCNPTIELTATQPASLIPHTLSDKVIHHRTESVKVLRALLHLLAQRWLDIPAPTKHGYHHLTD